eukprot:2724532-Karenia_brevis.AAC.1
MARTEVEAKKLCRVVKSLAVDGEKVSVLKWKGQVSWSWLPIAKVVVDAQHEPTELRFNETNLRRSGIEKEAI